MTAHKLSEYLKPPPKASAIEVDRQWWEVRARLRRRSQLRRGVTAAALLGVVGLFAVLFRSSSSAPEVWQGATVSSTRTAVSVSLHEGTRVELQPQTRLQVAVQSSEEVLLLLDEGSVRLDVVKLPGRRFIVRAADVYVSVVGTQFDVRRSGGQIGVVVYRGIVEVRSGDQLHRLVAGESWSRGLLETAAAVPVIEPSDAVDPDDASEPVRAPGVTKRSKVKKVRPAAREVVVALAPPAAVVVPAAIVAPVTTARQMFDAAAQARSKGNAKDAIASFQQLLLQFPESSFAPLSAFELGRLQMDSRHDPRAAAAAFEKVLAIASESSLSEDAMGRLVEAYASFDVGACRKARARYLSAYPSGTHAKDVTSSCHP